MVKPNGLNQTIWRVIYINSKFLDLPKEKQQKIINAGFEVFSKCEYKRASTEEIASIAGISKGLLFYYFHDKKTFYTFLFEQAFDKMKAYVADERLKTINDFFELCAYASERKYNLLLDSPYIMDFFIRAFYAQKDTTPEDVQKKMINETEEVFFNYFQHIAFGKFRDDVNPKEIFHMLIWMADGYMHERQRAEQMIGLNELMDKFRLWSSYLKRISYKEEFLK